LVAKKKIDLTGKRNLAKLAMRFGVPAEIIEIGFAGGSAAEAVVVKP
jgi:hypothetical protein